MKSKSPQLEIQKINTSNEAPFHLLEMADPSLDQINEYLIQGECFVGKIKGQTIGVLVLVEIDSDTIEIKNIAVDVEFQQMGYAKQLLHYSYGYAFKNNKTSVLIGTGNSSIYQLYLYQKEGFEMESIRKNFFTKHYSEPLFENSIQCKHMIVLRKKLRK